MNWILRNANFATMTDGYGIIERGLAWIRDGRIAWIGPESTRPRNADGAEFDADGGWVTPGLIDCHTHLVHAGNRSLEFEMRLGGRSYVDIAHAGGGIRSTVAATRAADSEALFQSARTRAHALMREGVTTIEIKSGYGLDWETERKMLLVARRLGEELPIDVIPTFLGAHANAEGQDTNAYIDLIVETMIPAVARERLATSVDAFLETIAFDADQVRRVFRAAHRHGLDVKLHADQLSDSGGGALAAEFHALSADHLEWTSEASVAAMAEARTVAVLLPGAFYALRETRKPPVESFCRHGVAMAVATDANPGTSPTNSLLLMMNMACVLFGLTPEEALLGVTRNAAKALGIEAGVIAVGRPADLALFAIDHPRDLACGFGRNPLRASWKDGIEALI